MCTALLSCIGCADTNGRVGVVDDVSVSLINNKSLVMILSRHNQLQ